MQWTTYPDDRLRAHAQRSTGSNNEVEPCVLEAHDCDGYIGRFAVIARRDRDTVTVIPLDEDGHLAQFGHATALVDLDRMYEYDRERFLSGHVEAWTDAVSSAAVETYLRRSRASVPFDDEYDTAEREAIQGEPVSRWVRLRHPEV